jgi:hypothetical protein
MGIVVDCTSTPSVAALRAAGVVGVTRYLAPLPNAKIITKAEFDRLIAGRISVALNWEHAANDWLGGGKAGTAHATEAIRQARALGYPGGHVIIGSADFDMTLSQWNSVGHSYAMEFASTLVSDGYLPGVYGPSDVLGWCQRLGIFREFWQAGMSKGWSGGRNAARWPGAHLRQLRGDTFGGVEVDVNEILKADYGQYQPWAATTAATTTGDGDMDAGQAKQLADIDYTLLHIQNLATTADGDVVPLHVWAFQQSQSAARVEAALAGSAQRENAMLAAIAKLAAGGTSVDTAAVIAAIHAVGDQESASVSALQHQLADAQARLAVALAPPAAG